ncbi:hypothetical protein PtA15_11A537 [Puccinia triticina]|uniref:PAS domain-containing protein n=1 Tax=Puccinia triticina TaxID=208348 RepID=A0ABY7CY24_9BASI|nr:uncharacterized protein PtA15_11A537 [Puccinia triticina]WAQ89845.1 hypothetical protein PtA15_11A537 [Puccinia triticina]
MATTTTSSSHQITFQPNNPLASLIARPKSPKSKPMTHMLSQDFKRRKDWHKRLVEDVMDVLQVIGPTGELLFVSESMARLTGFPTSELLGNQISNWCFEEEDRLNLEREIKHCFSPGSSGIINFYCRFKKKDSPGCMIFEISGHLINVKTNPGVLRGETKSEKQVIIINARPYPTSCGRLTDEFLELMLENEAMMRVMNSRSPASLRPPPTLCSSKTTPRPTPVSHTPKVNLLPNIFTMPEPPKITTSLADRIARLNATQAHSLDRNHAQVQQQVGEIKSKISKYEATGQHEAPLIPKGSFGLGAPLTKPDRGLDRIRIASLGVSGGTTVSIKSPSSLSASTGPSRSVSLGRPDTRRLSNLSSDHHSQPSPTHSPSQHTSDLLPTPPHESADPLAEQAPPSSSPAAKQQDPQDDPANDEPAQEANRSFDSADAYDGILDGYPTTPADEDCPPMVTCSNCSQSVELELLGEHVCEPPSSPPSRAKSPTEDQPAEGARQPPVDVPVDVPVESPALVISQERKDPSPPSPSSICSSSKRTHDPSTTTDAQPAPELSPKDPHKNRLSDSSHSTNTTRLSTGPVQQTQLASPL